MKTKDLPNLNVSALLTSLRQLEARKARLLADLAATPVALNPYDKTVASPHVPHHHPRHVRFVLTSTEISPS